MVAIAILVGKAAIDGVARAEVFALLLAGKDQGVVDGSKREAMLELRAGSPARARRAVDLVAVEQVAVRGAENRGRQFGRPFPFGRSDPGGYAAGGEPIPATVQGIGMGEGEGIEPVELASAGQR
jgi:hypothetical protein